MTSEKPRIEYTSSIAMRGAYGIYSKTLNTIYLHPALFEYPELHDFTLGHEMGHWRNSQCSFLGRVIRDLILDYRDFWKFRKAPKMMDLLSAQEQVYQFLYDLGRCPIWLFQPGNRLRHLMLYLMMVVLLVG